MFDWTKNIKRFWPAIILALALVLIVDGTISSLETCHPPNSASNSQNSDKDCTVLQGPLVSLIIVIGDFVGDHDKGIVAAFTVILALSTIGLWTASINLYKATIATAQAQSDDTRILERAYLSVKPLGIETFRTKDFVVGMIAIYNAGRLPAQKVTWTLYLEPDTDNKRKIFISKEEDFVGDNIIPAGGEMIKGTGKIEIAKFPDVIANKPQVYVWGSIRYDNGFGKNCTTTFCHRYDVSGVIPDRDGTYTVPAKDGRHHEYGSSAD
jgi:hypothetical protein